MRALRQVLGDKLLTSNACFLCCHRQSLTTSKAILKITRKQCFYHLHLLTMELQIRLSPYFYIFRHPGNLNIDWSRAYENFNSFQDLSTIMNGAVATDIENYTKLSLAADMRFTFDTQRFHSNHHVVPLRMSSNLLKITCLELYNDTKGVKLLSPQLD